MGTVNAVVGGCILPAARAGRLRIGFIFDPLGKGFALQVDPPVWTPAEKLMQWFGGALDAPLRASTHAPSIERIDGQLRLNPGSATLPGKNAAASFARLSLSGKVIEAEIVSL